MNSENLMTCGSQSGKFDYDVMFISFVKITNIGNEFGRYIVLLSGKLDFTPFFHICKDHILPVTSRNDNVDFLK